MSNWEQMSRKFILIWFSIIFCLLWFYPAIGNQHFRKDSVRIKPYLVSSHTFDKYYSNKDFDYQQNKDIKSVWNLWWMKLMKLLEPVFSHHISTIILYAFFIGVFILLMILLLGADFQSIIQRKRTITLGSVVFDKENSGPDIDGQIQGAIKGCDYTKAIRLMYIKTLQILNASHLIVWQKEKTNRDYQIELNHTKYYGVFKQITMIYEYTWYGKFPVTSGEYFIYEKEVHELNNLLDAQ